MITASLSKAEQARRRLSLERNQVEKGREVCRFCDGFVFGWPCPVDQSAESWHDTAKCVEGDEPSFKNGGPA